MACVVADETSASRVITLTGAFADRDHGDADAWCPIERALDVIGTRSAMTLVREAFYGARRFDVLARRAGVNETIASKRLKQLVDARLMERMSYREPGQRTRMEYVLTDRGRRLFPLLVALMEWGGESESEGGGVELVHAGCGAPLQARVACAHGHDVELAATEARVKDPRDPQP